MKLNLDKVECLNPRSLNRNTDGCDYFYEGKYLFHERSYFPWSIFEKSSHEQWFSGFVLTQAKANELAAKHGGHAHKCFYGEDGDYFLLFTDSDKALAFVQTEDYDALASDLSVIHD
ncbi:MAG: hypothetical protein KGI71_06235 [Patescibacteria group bacterium]|nr:hypothetical protein [Patescibacteria group bacterium]